MNQKTIDNNFTYHPPKKDQPDMYMLIRTTGKKMAETIQALCPDSREKALAFTNLEQAIMWANASIARNEAVEGR